jgi:mono/diheme cytochrome c family protein
MKTSVLLATLCFSLGAASAVAAQAPSALDGKTIFEQSCKACHGANGVPSPAMVKMMGVPTFNAALFAKLTDDSVVTVLKKGRGKMKPMADKLTPDQMLIVAKYIRTMAK